MKSFNLRPIAIKSPSDLLEYETKGQKIGYIYASHGLSKYNILFVSMCVEHSIIINSLPTFLPHPFTFGGNWQDCTHILKCACTFVTLCPLPLSNNNNLRVEM